MALGRKSKGHDVIIVAANKLYEDSLSLFTEAEKKIDTANEKLDMTISELDTAIAELESLREKAFFDKDRNSIFKEKLKQFTVN